MSLNQLFRKSKLAAFKKAAVTSAVVASVAGFSVLTKSVDSQGNVIASSAGSSTASAAGSTGATGFATSNPVIKPSSSDSLRSVVYSPEACVKNPSVENCNSSAITQKDWDQFLPPEGIVVRDARGNVVFKKCRSLTEGAAAAKAEMDQEKTRFEKFNAAMSINVGSYHGGRESYENNYECSVKPNKAAPPEEPCPTLKNFTELKDYYRQQYYQMSNELQKRASAHYECRGIRDNVMAASDPSWKTDRGIASQVKSANAASGNNGVR